MDFSCKSCFDIWVCSRCRNRWCDDTSSPFVFVGKPEYWNDYDVIKDEEWLAMYNTKKQQTKMIVKYLQQPPTLTEFCLCEKCKNNYVDNNICKGRHKTKIKYKITNLHSKNIVDDSKNGKLTDDDCKDAEGNFLPFNHECWKNHKDAIIHQPRPEYLDRLPGFHL